MTLSSAHFVDAKGPKRARKEAGSVEGFVTPRGIPQWEARPSLGLRDSAAWTTQLKLIDPSASGDGCLEKQNSQVPEGLQRGKARWTGPTTFPLWF